MANTIVCGVDGSPESLAAAELGVQWATALGATAVLVHAVDAASFPRVESATGEIRAKRVLDAAHRALDEIQFQTPHPIERQVVAGAPAVALAGVAEERGALAVCVGSRGRGPLRAALLGSTSRAAVRECACPVLVVPKPAAARTLPGPVDRVWPRRLGRVRERPPSGGEAPPAARTEPDPGSRQKPRRARGAYRRPSVSW